jgi:hypothetical protein
VDLDLEAKLCSDRSSGLLSTAQRARPEAVDAKVPQMLGRKRGLLVTAVGEPVAIGVGQVASRLSVGDRLAVTEEVRDQLLRDPGIRVLGHRNDLHRQLAGDEIGDRHPIEDAADLRA